MKIFTTLIALALVKSTMAFTCSVPGVNHRLTTSSSSLQMGLLDFFNPEEQKKRKEAKEREVQEQIRLQNEIRERRNNPEKMEEYEAKVRVRRGLRMAGQDEAAEIVNSKMYDSKVETGES
mmetsp:Transcript_12434/g.19146  ORF Transcript_12434/g.19146 Transcript_12434/m.19146 type:complete len:121 (+) Transcript_12434:146-508(+)|eukprot:CAMPEP_0178919922 /NCGR_PEP_ID=MMETSP0786-20121207/14710_1 /TAXON_ID=186022 /ORGANISM="Thalassionema frauenfeldii, Strain CCMP 1798" /LENGTH=120 /DNA_ID=CAMNT_0020593915 /DNA_START=134 /DNA_END=496 /DNA_ORIENTATION=+